MQFTKILSIFEQIIIKEMHVLDEIDVKRPESLFQSPQVIQKSQFLPSKVLQANYFLF